MNEYDKISHWLRGHHLVTVGGNVRWSWSCSCGRRGLDTTQGRALAGRDRHLQAERRRYRERIGA